MMRLFLALLLLVTLAPAARADGLHVHVKKVEVDEFPRVRVLFDVKSFDKLPFRKVTAADVRITEEEVRIRGLELKPHRSGVSIGLVVDDSGSEDPSLGYLKEAADYLIEQLAPIDEMAVIGFGRVVKPLQQLTNDKRLMKDAIASLKAYGASALYDGIAVGMHESANGIGRQVVVVVSDGNEQDFPYAGKRLSLDTVPHLIRAARKWGINIYTIGIGSKVNSEVLTVLARETGGEYLAAPTRASLRALFGQIAMSFEGGYQATYMSPNIKEDKLVRGGRVDVAFAGRSGSGPFRYTVKPETSVSTLTVRRTAVWKDKHARLRVYTRGERGTWIEMEFTLRDSQGKTVRQGRTTRDGYGAPAGGGMPELLELEPGRYKLDVKEPGTDLVFSHDLVLEQGRSTDVTYNYSKLVFRRNGQLWYDTQHALGDTSDLIDLTIEDLTARKVLRTGPLSVFKHRREASVWLEEGAYRVRLDNHLGDAKIVKRHARKLPAPAGIDPSVLRNALTTELRAYGGDVLFFDVAYDDFRLDEDPRLIPDELPEMPRLGEEPPMNLALSERGKPPYDRHLEELRSEPVEETMSPFVSAEELREAKAKRKKAPVVRDLPTTAHDRDAAPGKKRRGTSSKPKAEKPAASKTSKEPPAPKDASELFDDRAAAPEPAEKPETLTRDREPVRPEERPELAKGASRRPSDAAAAQASQDERGLDTVAKVGESALACITPAQPVAAPKPASSPLGKIVQEFEAKGVSSRPSGSASSRDESDGSVYISRGAARKGTETNAKSAVTGADLAEALALQRKASRADVLPGAQDEIVAKVKRMREQAQARRAEAPASADPLSRLKALAQ